MRLFIAIPLAEEMKKELVACMHDLKKQGVEGSYVPAQNLHLTLAFIGEYDNPAQVKKSLGERAPAALSAEPVGEGKLRRHSLGRREGKPEAENLCKGSAGGFESRRDSLCG